MKNNKKMILLVMVIFAVLVVAIVYFKLQRHSPFAPNTYYCTQAHYNENLFNVTDEQTTEIVEILQNYKLVKTTIDVNDRKGPLSDRLFSLHMTIIGTDSKGQSTGGFNLYFIRTAKGLDCFYCGAKDKGKTSDIVNGESLLREIGSILKLEFD